MDHTLDDLLERLEVRLLPVVPHWAAASPRRSAGPSFPPLAQEPFSILPLEAISDSVLNNVRELQATHGGGGAAAGRTGMPRVSAAQLVDAAEAAAAVGAGAENGRPLTH